MSSPIAYTSRTFSTVLNDLNNTTGLADKPDWFKKYIAGLADLLNMYINATANQSFLRTAFTRQAVFDLCTLIDYAMTPIATSSGVLLIYLDADTVAFPKTVTQANLVAQSEGSLTISSLQFEARAATVQASTSEIFTTNFAADNNLDVARVYTTGEKVRVSTSNTLPGGLSTGTDYYVIKISATEIRLATSIANAYLGTEITLTDDGVGNHTVTLYSIQVDFYQQKSGEADIDIGTSDGITSWQEFDLPDVNILEDTITLTINSLTWTRVDSFIDSTGASRHFLLRYNSDGTSFIKFGNGTYGAIPGNFPVYANYAYGGGEDSNVSEVNTINTYAGSDSDVTGVSNPSTFTGADDEESISSAKNTAPILLKTRDRFVTQVDGETLAENYSGVSIARVNGLVYGSLSAQVLIVPNGGGAPSAPLKAALDVYLTDRCILDSIDVRVEDPTYVPVAVTATVKILSGYVFADVQVYVVLALRLLFSEVTKEIKEEYENDGIVDAVASINTKWSTSFGTADYDQIIILLENVSPTEFGKDFEESDVLAYIDSYVAGVDYWSITIPGAWPVSIDTDEISQDAIVPANITEVP